MVPGRRRKYAGAGTEGPGGYGDGHFWNILPHSAKKRARIEIKSCQINRGVGVGEGRWCYKGEGADGIDPDLYKILLVYLEID